MVVCLGRIFIQNTYAKFTSGYETGNDIANLNLSFDVKISNLEEYEEISVGANSYEVFNVNVKNSSSTTTYYGVWYMMASPKEKSSDIVIARSNDSSVSTSGSIESGKDVTITIIIKNNSGSNIKVNIGVASSVKSVSDIEYLGGKKLISGITDIPTRSLFDIVKKNAVIDNVKSTYVSSDSGIDFSDISSDTNGKGIYIRSGTENNTYPIYYYRGDIGDNNVLFAGFCWKIVRTTDTGGIKLIYNGVKNGESCNNDGDLTEIGSVAFNSSYNSPAYVGYMHGKAYESGYKDFQATGYLYGTDVTYSNGIYTLVNYQSGEPLFLKKYHYTCLTKSSSCDKVYYIYYSYYNEGSRVYYILLDDGNKIDGALDEMFDNNSISSSIKSSIGEESEVDAWYKTNILDKGYTKYLEDTVFCNDRSIYEKNGFDINEDANDGLYFGAAGRYYFQVNYDEINSGLFCNNGRDNKDKFTVNVENGNGKLTYPVGLLTLEEVLLSGITTYECDTCYLHFDHDWALSSPYGFIAGSSDEYNAQISYVTSNGEVNAGDVSQIFAVHPSISLKNDTLISGGNGSSDSPYLVSLS